MAVLIARVSDIPVLLMEIRLQSFFLLSSSIKRTSGCFASKYSLGGPAATIAFTDPSPA